MQAHRLPFTEDRIFKMFLVLSTHVLFIYINMVMLVIVWSKSVFRGTARYILFAHMLFNDTLHLGIGLVLYLLGAYYLTVVRAACAFIVLLSACTFTNAPLNLAVMSLERYTAICFPLHHSELATPRRTQVAVLLVWALGCINVITDVVTLFLAEPSFFLSPAVCTIEQLQMKPWQRHKGVVLNVLLFITVAAVLLYTYVAIMLEARSALSDSSSARRALHTVLLHAIQLGLSLMSFLYVLLEFLLAMLPIGLYAHLRFVNFFVVLILPRCLSSLIYGVRDEAFRPIFRKHFLCGGLKKVGPGIPMKT
ncbi:odorant receptor 131-2-like [Chanos chanos]|uniref:Odorant receptor 131-2-like n=1 Tax=Chanos chanos TaxID=29144 RepID=A0A6J2W632_CHACN|nr:odorant receptor 131-2-like [Chanos chanos]